MRDNPLVSYIIPSYNHAPYIEKAIESVLNQTYEPIELIIIDDGSTDNTREVLEKYIGLPGITVEFNEINLKQGKTITKGVGLSKGEYIGILPSDDWLLPNKVEKQVDLFRRNDDVGVVYSKGARYFIDQSGNEKIIETNYKMFRGGVTEKLLLHGNFIYPVTPLYKRSCFEDYKYDEALVAEGEEINLKISLTYNFDYVDEVLAVMRDHEENTGKKTDLMYEETIKATNAFFARDDIPENLKKYKVIKLARHTKIKAMERIISHHDFKSGRNLAFKALSYDVGYLKDVKFLLAILVTLIPERLALFSLKKLYRKRKKV